MTTETDANGAPDYALLDRMGAGATAFYPRPDPVPPPPGASDHRIEVAPGIEVAARLYAVDPTYPTIVYFHGNGEVASDHDGIAPLYHAAGANLFVAEFRGYGRSTGAPSMAALVADAHPVAAFADDLLAEQGFAGPRFIMGRSLGSHPALELAARRGDHYRGLIVESGAAGLRRMLERFGLADDEEARRLADAHEAKIRAIRLPTLIIHGERDDLVPLSAAAELYDLLDGTERELVVIYGAGHNDLLWVGRDRYFEAIAAFVGEH